MTGFTTGSFPGYSRNGYTGFIRKYDFDGNELWTDQFDRCGAQNIRGMDRAYAIYVHASGVYVVGDSGQQGFICKYDPNGNSIWSFTFRSDGYISATGVSGDATGIYVVGGTTGYFDGQTNAGKHDVYIRKYDFNGNDLWTRQFGTAGEDGAMNVYADSSGVYVAGYLHQPDGNAIYALVVL